MAVIGWPTDAGAGQVATEDRWVQMARLWTREGVVDGISGEMAPSFAAGQVTIQAGAAWINGHYAVNDAPVVVPTAANGLVVLRYTLAGNVFAIAFNSGATVPTQTPAVYEIALADVTGGVMSDRRTMTGGGVNMLDRVSTNVGESGIGSTMNNLDGITASVFVSAGRLIRVIGRCGFTQRTAAGVVIGFITEDNNVMQHFGRASLGINEQTAFYGAAILTPAAGGHTYRLAANTTAGTVDTTTNSTNPAFMTIEDLGAA
jgi:hypothetical protein